MVFRALLTCRKRVRSTEVSLSLSAYEVSQQRHEQWTSRMTFLRIINKACSSQQFFAAEKNVGRSDYKATRELLEAFYFGNKSREKLSQAPTSSFTVNQACSARLLKRVTICDAFLSECSHKSQSPVYVLDCLLCKQL